MEIVKRKMDSLSRRWDRHTFNAQGEIAGYMGCQHANRGCFIHKGAVEHKITPIALCHT